MPLFIKYICDANNLTSQVCFISQFWNNWHNVKSFQYFKTLKDVFERKLNLGSETKINAGQAVNVILETGLGWNIIISE